MEHIEIQLSNIDYPVGSNLKSVKQLAKIYAEAFLKIGYLRGTKINLWCRGSSGAILATAFSLDPLLNMYEFYICHVKKEGEISHSSPLSAKATGAIDVIIDDFVATGNTIRAIIHYMKIYHQRPQILIVNSSGKSIDYPFEYLISNN